MAKPNVVFILGGPGAGKGTQCQKIVNSFHFVHLSAGDLLREERQNRPESDQSKLIEKHIREGSIVPVEITCSLIEQAMIENQREGKNDFLIDGFPRNQDNLEGWNRQMAAKVNLKFVIFFECDEEVCIERCLNRGKSSGRSDDNIDSLKKRIVTYNDSTKSIIQHYEEAGLVQTIDAAQSEDKVFEDVKKLFED